MRKLGIHSKSCSLFFTFIFILSTQILLAEARELAVDTEKSEVTWVGKKIIGQHEGTVKLLDSKVLLDGDVLVGGEFSINLNTIQNKDLAGTEHQAKLEGHLKSDDFFNISKYPAAKFVITEAKAMANSSTDYSIKGNLTVKGITLPVEFPATIVKSSGVYSADGKLSIDRTKWDIRYNSGRFFDPAVLGDKLIYDEIEIGVKILTRGE